MACDDAPPTEPPTSSLVHLPLAVDGEASQSVKLGQESRTAVRVRPGERLQRVLVVPNDSRLEVAGGATCPQDRSCQGTAEFVVQGTRGEAGPALFSRRFRLPVPSPSWRRVVVDLDAWAGRRIVLELAASLPETADGGSSDDPPRPTAEMGSEVSLWWAEPLILHPREQSRPNVVLVSIDTLRADRLGVYGHHRDTSPALDALAAEGTRFDRAISQAPWTTPAHMSLMTSMYPSTHGVNPSFAEFLEAHEGRARYPSMSHELTPLARQLRDHGYLTLGVTGGVTVGAELGFARGFDRYFDDARNPPSPELQSRLLSWLRTYGGSPFFLFFHTFEVHAPYSRLDFADDVLTPEERQGIETFWRRPHENALVEFHAYLQERGLDRAVVTSALYDGGVRQADRVVSTLLHELRDLGVYDRTLIIVTSDHGEEFGEHDPARVYDAHCDTLYDELIRVPLILKAPGRQEGGRVVDEVVELIDVAPTVLDLVDIEVPEEMQGASLRSFVSNGPTSRRPPADEDASRPRAKAQSPPSGRALSESTCNGPEWKSLRTAGHKYIATFEVADMRRSGIPGKRVREQLYDLRADPGERHDLTSAAPPVLASLRERLIRRFVENAKLGAEHTTGETGLSEEMLGRLRALGYIR